VDRLILITLLVKLGVAAAVASALVRSKEYKDNLFREHRTMAQEVLLVLFTGFVFALGVIVRGSVHNFLAADLAFEAAILVGVIAGPLPGAMAGLFISAPSLMFGEWANVPFDACAGALAGVLRNAAGNPDDIWTFTPFLDLNVYRWVRRYFRHPRLDWQTGFFLVILLLNFIRIELAHPVWDAAAGRFNFPHHLFALASPQWAVMLAIYATSLMCIAIPLKIFNNARIERKLEEQERALLQARMEALQSQINPHFLFNTLNSVSSLVRRDPNRAREVIVKLASIMRRRLQRAEAFTPLSEEMDFIDDYLDIEVVRFGPEKLRVTRELEPASLDVMVPSMILQPLVENAIKHGISPKIGGGRIVIRSRLQEPVRSGDPACLVIEVEDDGVGMGSNSVSSASREGAGIGMANVIERLKVLYGHAAALHVNSRPGEGTMVQLRLPVLQSFDESPAAAAPPGR
jgi:two-component system LytT family sensor kinase